MRNIRFTYLCNSDERRLLSNLAKLLQRTQSDVIRVVLQEKAKALGVVNTLTLLEKEPNKPT